MKSDVLFASLVVYSLPLGTAIGSLLVMLHNKITHKKQNPVFFYAFIISLIIFALMYSFIQSHQIIF